MSEAAVCYPAEPFHENLYQRQAMAIEDRVKHRKPLDLH